MFKIQSELCACLKLAYLLEIIQASNEHALVHALVNEHAIKNAIKRCREANNIVQIN
jgi:hypothetical protein